MKPNSVPVWRKYSLLTLLILVSLLASCNLPASTGGVSVWLDVPLDGLAFDAPQPIKIEGHASSANGISRIEIWINGALLTTINNPPMQGNLTTFNLEWTPPAEGEYTIQALAFSADGTASLPDSARVTFGASTPPPPGGCPTPVGGGPTPVSCDVTPTPLIACPSPVGGGPTPVSCDVTPTPPIACPSPVGGGPTPVSCGVTPPPPGGAVVQFWADPSTITAGACTTLRWHVENVSRVVFGGVDQPFDGSYRDCLCSNQRYTLTVIHLDGREERRSVDIAVTGSCVTPTSPPPADTTPPPAPTLQVPANGLTLSCRGSQSLVWLPVDDASGIAEYQVQVQRHAGDNNWQPAPGSPFSGIYDKQTTISVECGWYYRWRVRAVDGAGNVGPWSDWFEFAVTLG
jgi:hypothetical protein